MRSHATLFILSLTTIGLVSAATGPASWTYRGVVYDADWENSSSWFGTPASERQLTYLKDLGVNALTFMPLASQPDLHKPDIDFRSILEEGMAQDIQTAKGKGFKVALKPLIFSDQFNEPSEGNRRGRQNISMDTPANWAAWFENYERMICSYAAIAEQMNLDLFVIGQEYQETTKSHTTEWKRLIKSVRKIYHGPLTYAAQDMEEANQIQFWDDLDVIGINGYFSLTKDLDPALDDLLATWKKQTERLSLFSQTHANKQILLTEGGYANADGTAENPHEWWPAGTAVDRQEQVDCYTAMFQALSDQPWLKGIFLWKYKIGVTPVSESREPSEAYFVFQEKPAERVIQSYFKGEKP